MLLSLVDFPFLLSACSVGRWFFDVDDVSNTPLLNHVIKTILQVQEQNLGLENLSIPSLGGGMKEGSEFTW